MVYKRKDLMSSDSLGEKSFLASEENGFELSGRLK